MLRDFPFLLLTFFLLVLWLAGGASRADVFGQAVVRSIAWIVLAAALIFGRPPRWSAISSVAIFLGLVVLSVALQLVPLPPDIWTSLPGRELLVQSAVVSDQVQPWRPISLSPDATVNALSSLIVPVVIVYLMGMQSREARWPLVTLLLALIIAGCLVGLMRFAGSSLDNPLINDVGDVAGNFANRNHMALFAGFGCVLAPVWAYSEHDSPKWRALVAAGLQLFFLLLILATGSRAGILFGVVGSVIGLLAVRQRLQRQLRNVPRKVRAVVVAVLALTMAGVIALSIGLGRAISVDRANDLEIADDLRGRALPTIMEMVDKFWPIGSGYGTFDPAYRISEPDSLLSIVYLNRAHNDLLEIILDGGIVGAALLLAAFIWIGWKSVRAWKAPVETATLLARAGFGMLLLIILGSIFDYPARTPMVMALAAMVAIWLLAPRSNQV